MILIIFPNAKIITFGIAHSGDYPPNAPNCFSNPARLVAMLRNVDGFNYLDNAEYHVDGYGTHLYTSPNNPRSFVTLLNEDMASLGNQKPFWVTEWGFTQNAFPTKNGQTVAEVLHAVLGIYDELGRTVSFGPLMFYSYNDWLTDKDGNLLPQANVLADYANSTSDWR